MSLAQHLAIADIGGTTLAPGRYVVCIHFVELINLGANIIMSFCTFRAIADALLSCLICLTGIHRLLHTLFKDADVQQMLVSFSTKQIFKDSPLVGYSFIGI